VAAGTAPIDSWNSTPVTTTDADSSWDGDTESDTQTLITSAGVSYQLVDEWDAINYPSAGSCGYQVLGVQG
jgi:hypothetical protein